MSVLHHCKSFIREKVPGFRLLVHSNTTDGSTVFEDSSEDDRIVTPYLGIAHSSTCVGIGTTSIHVIYHTTSNTQRLETDVPISDYTAFTIDFWAALYATNLAFRPFGFGDAMANLCVYMTSSVLSLYANGGQVTSITDISVANVLHHIELGFDGTQIYMFLDGVLVAVKTGGIPANLSKLYIGGHRINATSFGASNGYIDEFAIRSECVHSGSGYSLGDTVFTPPTTPYGT